MDENLLQNIVNFLTRGTFPIHLVNSSKTARQNFKKRASTFELDKESNLYKVLLIHRFFKFNS